jgi:Uma2 family endonuclease
MALAVPPFPIARFSVEQYHRMLASGAFTEHDRVELIDGWVVQKMAKGPQHEFVTGELEALLRERVPTGWHVRNQAPVTLSESEPEPDLAVARGSRGDYRARHPHAQELALVVEISDTTLTTDRLKAGTYSAARIPEYWLVNLASRVVEVHRDPSDEGYRTHETFGETQRLSVRIGEQDAGELAVGDFLP